MARKAAVPLRMRASSWGPILYCAFPSVSEPWPDQAACGSIDSGPLSPGHLHNLLRRA